MTSHEVEVEALYAKRAKIHAREVKGFFANLRNTAVIVLLGIYTSRRGRTGVHARPSCLTCPPASSTSWA